MHEWGLTGDVVKEILKHAKESNIVKIDKVDLAIGDKANLTEESVKYCLSTLTKNTILNGAEFTFKNGEGKGILIETIEGIQND